MPLPGHGFVFISVSEIVSFFWSYGSDHLLDLAMFWSHVVRPRISHFHCVAGVCAAKDEAGMTQRTLYVALARLTLNGQTELAWLMQMRHRPRRRLANASGLPRCRTDSARNFATVQLPYDLHACCTQGVAFCAEKAFELEYIFIKRRCIESALRGRPHMIHIC